VAVVVVLTLDHLLEEVMEDLVVVPLYLKVVVEV
jgi:hypothetical protein